MPATDIRFEANGLSLAGRLYRPVGAGPHPVIVLSHGFSVLRAMGLDDYCARFEAAGFACLAYDHRNFGESDGLPRHEIDPWQQVADTRDAISFVRSVPGLDPERVGLWGTSFSGGHALVVAALDRRVKCVVSQVPLVAGFDTLNSWVGPGNLPTLTRRFNEDRDGRYCGAAPRTTRPARPGDQTWTWVTKIGAETLYPNEITQRSLENLAGYEPGSFIARVSPTPLLMILATQDTQTPYAGQRAAYDRAGAPKQLLALDCGHYDPYTSHFDESAQAAVAWFQAHLVPAP